MHTIAFNRIRWRRLLAVLTLCLGLAACGTKLGYNLVDRVILWRVDSYIDLDRDQKRVLQAEIQELHDWHRSAMLPQHVAQIRRLRDAIADSRLDAATVEAVTADLEAGWAQMMNQLTPRAVRLLQDLEQEQIDHLLAKLEDDLADRTEELAESTSAERAAERAEDLEEFYSDWIGRLTPAQEDAIAEYGAASTDLTALVLFHRRQWGEHFAAALAERNSPDFAATIARLMNRPQELWTTPYREGIERNHLLRVDLTVRLMADLTDRQRGRIVNKLDELAEDLEELAAS